MSVDKEQRMIIYYSTNYDKNEKESHQLLEIAISDYLGDADRAKILVKGIYQCSEYGKPAIKDFADFSISHSGTCWAVLIDDRKRTDSNPCGLDIQYAKYSGYETVCRKYYAEEEQTRVEKYGRNEFFRLWARREALVKAVGTTIVNRNLPAVINSKVEFEGYEWRLQDVVIPGMGEDVLVAICYRAEADELEEVSYVKI